MSKRIFLIIFLFIVRFSFTIGLNAQCTVSSSSNLPIVTCGDTLTITISGLGSVTLADTFAFGGPSDTNWVSTAGAQYDEPYIPSPTNDDYFWMGPSATLPTALTTTAARCIVFSRRRRSSVCPASLCSNGVTRKTNHFPVSVVARPICEQRTRHYR